MSATKEPLLTLSYVTDHDCGNYYVGETDHGICVGNLSKFLKSFGHKGKSDLVASLAHLIFHVETTWRKEHEDGRGSCVAGVGP